MRPIDPIAKLRVVIRLLIPGGQLFDVLFYMVILNTPRADPEVYVPNPHFLPSNDEILMCTTRGDSLRIPKRHPYNPRLRIFFLTGKTPIPTSCLVIG